jgi:uncharacterized protein YkwD
VLGVAISSGCAVDPQLVGAIAAAIADASPGPTTTTTTTTGLPVPALDPGGLATTDTGLHDPTSTGEEAQVLEMMNQARSLAGLAPVTLDPEMSRWCKQHCHYLVLNEGSPATQGLKAHEEDPSLPGATPDGAKAGKASDISYYANPVIVMRGWIGTLYHRTPILNSSYTKIGFAIERGSNGYTVSSLMFGEPNGEPRKVVAFPVNGQIDVPVSFNHEETPDPTPDADGPTGYPVTLALPAWKKSANVKGQIFDADGRELPLYQSDAQHPATSFQQGDVLCMFTKQPFKPATKYRVVASAEVEGTPFHWEWSFTTLVPKTVAASDKDALTKAAGRLTYVTGKVASGGTNSSGLKFLDLGNQVVAFIDAKVWGASGKADPKTLKGKAVRLLCTPKVPSKGSQIELKPMNPEDIEVTS